MINDYPDVLTIDDITVILRISRRSVMRLINDGDLKCRKIGRIYRISKNALIDYLNSQSNDK